MWEGNLDSIVRDVVSSESEPKQDCPLKYVEGGQTSHIVPWSPYPSSHVVQFKESEQKLQ